MGTINIFPYPLAVAVYESQREKEVNTVMCFQRGVLGVHLPAETFNSPMHV